MMNINIELPQFKFIKLTILQRYFISELIKGTFTLKLKDDNRSNGK